MFEILFEFALKHVQKDVLMLGNTDSEKRHADKTDAVICQKWQSSVVGPKAIDIRNESHWFHGVAGQIVGIFLLQHGRISTST